MFTKRNYLVGIIIFVAVWAAIFIVPDTHALFDSQIWRTSVWGITTIFKPYIESNAVKSLAKKRPDDPRIQATLVKNTYIDTSDNTEYHLNHIHQYDKLINRFPTETWLITERLCESATRKFKSPQGAYYIKGDQRIYMKSENWMNNDELKQTLKIAQLGQKKEPNNSFYNWIEAMCQYSLGNDHKALDALQRGSHKTDFNDGGLQRLQNKIYVHGLSTHLIFEDKLLVWATPIMLHIHALEKVNRIAIWQGAKEELAGNHQKALDIYGAQIRLNFVMLAKSQQIITRLTAQRFLLQTWVAFSRRDILGKYASAGLDFVTSPQQKKELLSVASGFANYASSHHRDDLAKESMAIAKSILNDFGSARDLPADFFMAVPQSQVSQISQLKWIGFELLTVILISIILMILILPLSYLLKQGASLGAFSTYITSSFSSIMTCLLFILISITTGIIFILNRNPDNANLFVPMFSDQSIVSSETPHSIFHILTTWVPRSVYILLLSWCFIAVLWKMRKSTFTHMDTPTQNKALAIIGRVATWIVALALQFWWIQVISKQTIDSSTPISNLLFLIIPLPLVLFLILYWYLQRPQRPDWTLFSEAYWFAFITRLQHSLALLILVCTVAYGISSWASLPLRNKANAKIDLILKVGEVAALREAIQHEPNSSP